VVELKCGYADVASARMDHVLQLSIGTFMLSKTSSIISELEKASIDCSSPRGMLLYADHSGASLVELSPEQLKLGEPAAAEARSRAFPAQSRRPQPREGNGAAKLPRRAGDRGGGPAKRSCVGKGSGQWQ